MNSKLKSDILSFIGIIIISTLISIMAIETAFAYPKTKLEIQVALCEKIKSECAKVALYMGKEDE